MRSKCVFAHPTGGTLPDRSTAMLAYFLETSPSNVPDYRSKPDLPIKLADEMKLFRRRCAVFRALSSGKIYVAVS